MSIQRNQRNKERVWDYWQKMNHATPDQLADVVRKTYHNDVNWNGPHPINHLHGAENLISGFWEPFRKSFPDVKRKVDILMGGLNGIEEWVSGVGYFAGTFAQEWLGIPATGRKTNIYFGQFILMREGKIAESYLILDLLSVMRQSGFQILPPAQGMEGGKIPGPTTRDGIQLTVQDELETSKTRQMVSAMGEGMENYVRSRDGGNLQSMEQGHYWHPKMHWYGPSGIGACFSLQEFDDFHQRPWLEGFGDRHVWKTSGGRYMGPIYEGAFGCGGVWDTPFSRNHGMYLGIPATGKMITIRDFDWYRREGDCLMQNWVPIDMINLVLQMGVDVFELLQHQIDQRRRGRSV